MPKNIVLCCDGTDNEVATDSTNVLRLFRMLVRNDCQIAYYDSGVGTLVEQSAWTKFQKWLSRRLDAMVGHRIRENAICAYRFVVRNYQPEDRIFLFGFSRGAYTVRVVAGMIKMLGLVRPELDHLANLGWTIYANEIGNYINRTRFGGGNRFNKAFCIESKPPIHFVGAWDTVSAFGLLWSPKQLPFTRNNDHIVHFRHALSIDERRVSFQANMFNPNEIQIPNTKQVWFAGVHSDVGGGYPETENNATLSKVSLGWMIREATGCGLLIDQFEYGQIMDSKGKPPADPLGPTHESLEGLLWWALECSPWRKWDHIAERMRWQVPHVGGRRVIDEGATLHSSVEERRQKLSYWHSNTPKSYSIDQ